MQTDRSRQEGFTLIEIVVAVLIIGLMMGVAVPVVMNRLEEGKKTRTKQDLALMKSQIQYYNMRLGSYPASLRDLVRPPVDEKLRKKWTDVGGPFLEKEVEVDGWENPYTYRLTPGQPHPYELYSKGSGGEDSKESRISAWNL